MKIGDLVRWIGPGFDADVGLITKIESWPTSEPTLPGEASHVFIQWMVEPGASTYYPADHRYLELVNESR